MGECGGASRLQRQHGAPQKLNLVVSLVDGRHCREGDQHRCEVRCAQALRHGVLAKLPKSAAAAAAEGQLIPLMKATQAHQCEAGAGDPRSIAAVAAHAQSAHRLLDCARARARGDGPPAQTN